MNLTAISQFLLGAIAMGCWVIGLFLLVFWRRTGDRLLGIFGCAFWIMCITRVMSMLVNDASERGSHIYILRLIAYALILLAIIDKNRARKETAVKPTTDATQLSEV